MADTPNASGEPGELYLDAAATESVSPAVIEAMTPFLTDGLRQSGQRAPARQNRGPRAGRGSRIICRGIGARPDDVIFTSGGTESDNLAIKGIAMARMRKLGLRPVCGFAEADGKQPANCRPRIIISAIEHPAVAQSAAWLHEWFGFEVVRIPVDAQAHLDLDALEIFDLGHGLALFLADAPELHQPLPCIRRTGRNGRPREEACSMSISTS